MDSHERADIERQGAEAAARGAAWYSNPYLERGNMPAATGQTVHDWSLRHDAWQRGFEAEAARRPPRPDRVQPGLPG